MSGDDPRPLIVGNGDTVHVDVDGFRVERARPPVEPAPSTLRPGNWSLFERMPLKDRAWHIAGMMRGWYAGHPLSEGTAIPFRVDVAWQQFAWPIRSIDAAFELDHRRRWDGMAAWGCAYKEPFVVAHGCP